MANSDRLTSLKTRLAQYQTAETAILDGAQMYVIGSRRLERADLGQIAEMIKYLEKEISAEEAMSSGGGRNKVFGVIPRDI